MQRRIDAVHPVRVREFLLHLPHRDSGTARCGVFDPYMLSHQIVATRAAGNMVRFLIGASFR